MHRVKHLIEIEPLVSMAGEAILFTPPLIRKANS
jgi:hypothetical protein